MTAYTVTATVRSKAGALDPEAATTGTGTSVAPPYTIFDRRTRHQELWSGPPDGPAWLSPGREVSTHPGGESEWLVRVT